VHRPTDVRNLAILPCFDNRKNMARFGIKHEEEAKTTKSQSIDYLILIQNNNNKQQEGRMTTNLPTNYKSTN